tara:strand:- start:90 stop:398 length:309 start_codon:yes stop_codon:yes gene_type:complete
MKKGKIMTVTELLYRLVQRSDGQWHDSQDDTLHIGYSGWETRRETERSILQQSGVRLSEVQRLQEEGVVTDVVLDDYHVGLTLDIDQVIRHTDWSRERLELW